MAIYHCSIKIGSKGKGQSAVAAAAYRSGSTLIDENTETVIDYSKKRGIIYSEIMLCKNAPPEYNDRQTLWNAVHRIEKASNAQVYREIEVSLPAELTLEQHKKIIREYVQINFVNMGMCADWSIHDKNDGNPHCHILLTVRGIGPKGEWLPKSRKVYEVDEYGNRIKLKSGNFKSHKESANDWNEQYKAEEWRAAWAEICNRYLDETNRIDHRSYERQGIDLIPMIHEGFEARKIEREGGISERCELNRQIRRINREKRKIGTQLRMLENRKYAIERYGSGVMGHDEIGKLSGIGRDMGIYLRQLQKEALTESHENKDNIAIHDELVRTAELLTYVTFNNIRNISQLEEKLRTASDEEREETEQMYKGLVSVLYNNDFDFMIEMKRREAEESMQSIEDKLETALKTGEKIDSFLSEHSEEIKKASLTENAADEERKSSGYNSGWER